LTSKFAFRNAFDLNGALHWEADFTPILNILMMAAKRSSHLLLCSKVFYKFIHIGNYIQRFFAYIVRFSNLGYNGGNSE